MKHPPNISHRRALRWALLLLMIPLLVFATYRIGSEPLADAATSTPR